MTALITLLGTYCSIMIHVLCLFPVWQIQSDLMTEMTVLLISPTTPFLFSTPINFSGVWIRIKNISHGIAEIPVPVLPLPRRMLGMCLARCVKWQIVLVFEHDSNKENLSSDQSKQSYIDLKSIFK